MIKKLFAKTLDHFGISFLYRERSKVRHCKPGIGFPSDNFDEFYNTPDVPDLNLHRETQRSDGYEVGRFDFESPLTSTHPENDGARGEYYIRHDKQPSNRVSVVVIHGWRMEHLERVHKMFTKSFLQAGYDLYFPTAPYHFDRALPGSYSGEHLVTADLDHSVRSMRQTTSEIRALIRWIKQHRGGKVVVVGVSMGGYFSNMMALAEEEADYVISVMYGNSLVHSVWHTRIGRFIKQDMQQGGITLQDLEHAWRMTEPSRWQPKVPRENILFLHGLYDVYIPPADTNALWEAWGRPDRVLYPCGHAGIVLYRRQMARDVMNWLQGKLSAEHASALQEVAASQ
ncbi:alpha/beta fold hydrolase [Tumebacillus sp. ITR2]|uniref:Alpha/beta fold hydrolase n=1 Tax=Tumebacillus amylolyticus TaxID=2801339 RepID=A0ABS1J950_9BACL|nr:alpha/beta fold hydrolase [Tumebacillus amylolyticus]MBL0386808.1 alpha/beta fold hydrolase [Tumebacillus amylolyticus]